jgi:predicted metalloprotease with PDZ domain
VVLSFELPQQWLVSSVEKSISSTQFSLNDPDTAVFFTSRDLQRRTVQVKGMELTFAASGQWVVSPDDLMVMTKSIMETHANTMGGVPGERALVILSPFPKPESPQRWSAETRGSTVFLLAGLQPAKTAALVQLSLPLTHELFHLWVPNGLALEGDYDWFYEGFTIYQALRAAQRLNLVTFQDLLNAVGRAADTYSSSETGASLSLIDASQRRWTTNPAVVYQKAMVVAFLYDLTLRIHTGNKRSLEDVYREVFRRHRAGLPRAQGNEAVIEALSRMSGMEDFASRYVRAPVRLELAHLLARFGLRVESFGMRTMITVSPDLNREQRDLLRRLGYNSETRGSRNNH